MTDLGDAVRQSVALLYAHKRQKLPDKKTMGLILAMWAHNLKEFPPEIILSATSKVCGEEAFPELHHVTAACRAITGDEGWLVKFDAMLTLLKRRDGSLINAPSSPERTVALAMKGALDEIGPNNRTTLQAQFRDAYHDEVRRTRLKQTTPILLSEGEQPRAIPV